MKENIKNNQSQDFINSRRNELIKKYEHINKICKIEKKAIEDVAYNFKNENYILESTLIAIKKYILKYNRILKEKIESYHSYDDSFDIVSASYGEMIQQVKESKKALLLSRRIIISTIESRK